MNRTLGLHWLLVLGFAAGTAGCACVPCGTGACGAPDMMACGCGDAGCGGCEMASPCGGCGACGQCAAPGQRVRTALNRLACTQGCGEVYLDEWLDNPPSCCDPCDPCTAQWMGTRVCPPPPGQTLGLLWGVRYCGGCETGCGGCAGGHCGGDVIHGAPMTAHEQPAPGYAAPPRLAPAPAIPMAPGAAAPQPANPPATEEGDSTTPPAPIPTRQTSHRRAAPRRNRR